LILIAAATDYQAPAEAPLRYRVKVTIDGQEGIGLISSPIAAAQIAEHWPGGLKGEEDAGWDWSGLVRDHPHGAEWSQHQLTTCEHVQGAMILRASQPMRAPANTERSGVYIEYLATAPWNRKDDQGHRLDKRLARVVPVGRLLLGVAIIFSRKRGLEGRLGWHSKPRAEGWYKSVLPGLWEGGPDLAEDGLEYFELSQDVAASYLAGVAGEFLDK
jgi:hypothetical protein